MITNKRDFSQISNSNKCVTSKSIVMKYIPCNDSNIHLGLIASRKVGKAVIRNKLRRRIKSVIQSLTLNALIPSGYKYLVICRRTSPSLNFDMLSDELNSCFSRINNRLSRKSKRNETNNINEADCMCFL